MILIFSSPDWFKIKRREDTGSVSPTNFKKENESSLVFQQVLMILRKESFWSKNIFISCVYINRLFFFLIESTSLGSKTNVVLIEPDLHLYLKLVG